MKLPSSPHLVAFALALATLPFTGCPIKKEPEKPLEKRERREAAAARLNLTIIKDPAREECYREMLAIRPHFNESRFDELEALADRYRQSMERDRHGQLMLATFYSALECDRKEPESRWEQHKGIYKAWLEAKPESITARTAYTKFLISYGWKARGGGYASTVTKEGWRLFGERLQQARESFLASRKLQTRDPILYASAITIARAESWPREDLIGLFKEAFAAYPDDSRCLRGTITYLLPRWHGKEGEWEYFLNVATEKEGERGDALYAEVVLDYSYYEENLFKETAVSWPRTRKGLELLLAKYPESVTLRSQAAQLAAMAEDYTFAAPLFAALGDNVILHIWETPERFATLRDQTRAAATR